MAFVNQDQRYGTGIVSRDVEPTFLNHHAWALRWSDPVRSAEMAEAVLNRSEARRTGSRRRNGLAYRTLAWLAVWRGDFQRAEDCGARAEARLKNAGADDALISSLVVQATVWMMRLQGCKARTILREVPPIVESSPFEIDLTEYWILTSFLDLRTGRLDLAQDAIRNARRSAGSPALLAVTDNSEARALLGDGRPREAFEYAVRAIQSCEDHGAALLLPYALQTAASAMVDMRKTEAARDFLDRAFARAETVGGVRARCQILHEQSRLACQTGDSDAALQLALDGVALTEKLDYPLWRERFLERVTKLHERAGNADAALQALKSLVHLREIETH